MLNKDIPGTCKVDKKWYLFAIPSEHTYIPSHTCPQGPLAAAEENNIKQHTRRVVISKCTHLDLLLENVDLVLLLQELLLLSGNLQGRTCVRRGISLLVDSHSTLIIEHWNTEHNTDKVGCIDKSCVEYRNDRRIFLVFQPISIHFILFIYNIPNSVKIKGSLRRLDWGYRDSV